jgi:hypothetical protein
VNITALSNHNPGILKKNTLKLIFTLFLFFMIVYYLSFSDRPDVVIQNGSMMNIHENKQLTLTCSYDCLPPMEFGAYLH